MYVYADVCMNVCMCVHTLQMHDLCVWELHQMYT